MASGFLMFLSCLYKRRLLIGLFVFVSGLAILGLGGAIALQDDANAAARSQLRIDELRDELAKLQQTLGVRHPKVKELQVELSIRLRYVDQDLDLISRRIVNLEIDLAKADLQFSANHPNVKSLRKQITLWQQYSKQERIGSQELIRLDTEIEALRIEWIISSHLGTTHPLIIDLKKQLAELQFERNVLGLQEECQRQKMHIWKSEIDRSISKRAKKDGISAEQWLKQKSRAMGISQEQLRLNVIWRDLALEKLAASGSPVQDPKLQGLVKHFRNAQQDPSSSDR